MIFLALAFYISYYLRFHTGVLAEINKTYIIEKNYIFYSIIFILSAVLFFSYLIFMIEIKFTGLWLLFKGAESNKHQYDRYHTCRLLAWFIYFFQKMDFAPLSF